MSDKPIYPEGMSFFDPHKNAPDYVKGRISFNVGKFIEWADRHQVNGWLNLDVKTSQKGITYFALNQYKPGEKKAEPKGDDIVPTVQLTEEDDSNNNEIPF